ncbi:MAG TPA: long-chain-fatty-acid--CoA ligase [Candidatus Hydrogenedentes bacterium]|nr:long-chain-fatty-acid--CoA ligase [Candidatus Hydrogenedentota bacterium]HPG67194.1 long-chain-fatty-acid--CoA ligase [Candidatus Hydrogenedentota bacterium]
MTITRLLEDQAARYGDRTFCFCDDREYSFRTLNDHAARVAGNLAAQGVGEQDKVLLLMGNNVEFLYLFFGLGRIGAVCVPINPQLKPHEIAYIATNSEARVLVTIPEMAPLLPTLKSLLPKLGHVYVIGDAPEAARPFSELLAPVDAVPPIAARSDSEAALIYTSGTTGQPKGVVLTHMNYVSNARMISKSTSLTANDRFLCVLPMYHVNAQVVTVLTPLTVGADFALMSRFNPRAILPMIAKYRPTIMSAVPTIYHVMCSMPRAEEADVSSIRFFVSGAAPLPEETYRTVQRVLKKPLVQGYGLSEATCASAVADHLDPIKWDSVGPALPYTGVRIVDEQGKDLPAGKVGEILVSGPAVMAGYYKDPEATKSVFQEGWLRTGDLGRFDQEGYLFIAGRLKDMIIRGGVNIYPQQVENVLASLEGVAECCVVGVDESRWGQEVLAVIKPVESVTLKEGQVIDFCRDRLAAYKCPRYVRFVDEFPKTATGKIKKQEVAERFADTARDLS